MGSVPTSAARFTRRHRRALSASAAGVSILALGAALQPPGGPTRPVVVAARDLVPGHRLSSDDLTVAEVPAGLVPDGARTTGATLIGQVLGSAVSRGEVVGGGRLLAPPVDAGDATGMRAVPARFADPGAAALLAPGTRIDVLAGDPMVGDGLAGPPPAVIVAEDVLVLSVAVTEGGGGFPAVSGGDPAGPLVVLSVDPDQARSVAGAQAGMHLSFALRPTGRG